MTKIHRFALIMILACTLILSVLLPIVSYAMDSAAFDKLNVMDDLESSKEFSLLLYPYNALGRAKIMNVVEYCYSPYENNRANYGLYIYIYNPTQKPIVSNDVRNTVQLKTGVVDGVGVYEKFRLTYLSKSDDSGKPNRFYKFKVANPGKLLDIVNADKREYEISGFELVYDGEQNPKDFPTGGRYVFTGYAKGYGFDSKAESTLTSTVVDTEYIHIRDLAFTTSLSANNNANGAGHYNQFNSVYWTMPRHFEDDYGNLQKINFEYWEYKTSPILVTKDSDLYQQAYSARGKRVSPNTNNAEIPYYLTRDITPIASGAIIDWAFNKAESHSALYNETINHFAPQVPFVFERSKLSNGSLDVSSSELLNYIYSYDASNHTGNLPTRNISRDLFGGKVDAGHTEGYNNKTIDASEVVNLLEYDLNNGWNRFWYELFGAKPEAVSNTWRPIQRVTSVDDLNALKIGDNEKDDFKSRFNSLSNDSYMYLFTFALTDYYSAYVGYNGKGEYDKAAYIAETTAFLDFDMIAFTFAKDGKYTTIPVVSDPIDIIGNVWSPKDPDLPDWLLWLLIVLGIILLLILLPILAPILKLIIQAVAWIIAAPFKLIGKGVKAIRGGSGSSGGKGKATKHINVSEAEKAAAKRRLKK